MSKKIKVKKGDLVKVTYKHQAGNYRWGLYEMTAVYLATNPAQTAREFSLRPFSGTTQLDPRSVVDMEIVMPADELQKRGGARGQIGDLVHLPKRIKSLTKAEAEAL